MIKMRLDKFLKVSRIIKRRPLAKEIAEQGRIKVNDQVAKLSVIIDVTDLITIYFRQTTLTVKVLHVKEHVKKDEATTLYEVDRVERLISAELFVLNLSLLTYVRNKG